MPFKKGQSGNPGGRSTEKLFGGAIRAAVNADNPATGRRKLLDIAEKIVDLALTGEQWACAMVGDRMDGKPVQSVEVGEPGDFEHLSDNELMREVVEQAQELGIKPPVRTKANGRGNGVTH